MLVAEDTEANYAVARIFLTTAGYVVMRANNGREAVEMSRAADLILMDIEMPEMDGLEATRRIRAEEKSGGRQPIPILALTGHAVQGYRERCLAAGCTAYLTKPIRKQSLVDAVRAACWKERSPVRRAGLAGGYGGGGSRRGGHRAGVPAEALRARRGRLHRAMESGDWAECGRVGTE